MEKKVFLNVTNHISENWTTDQLEAAQQYGEISDIPFPQVNPRWSSSELDGVVDHYESLILAYGNPVVMLQGEPVFTFRLANRLKTHGITVLAAMTERRATEEKRPDGETVKVSIFQFAGFMEY